MGKRAFNLHIQGVFECYFLTNESKLLGKIILFTSTKQILMSFIIHVAAKIIKTEYIPSNGAGHQIMLKPFAKGQTFAGISDTAAKTRVCTISQWLEKESLRRYIYL